MAVFDPVFIYIRTCKIAGLGRGSLMDWPICFACKNCWFGPRVSLWTGQFDVHVRIAGLGRGLLWTGHFDVHV